MPNSKYHPRLLVAFGVMVLLALQCFGVAAYTVQFREGLGVSALSRSIPWGLYISQFTFLVGIAASSVVVLVPYYVHSKQQLGPLVMLGETVSVIALVEAMLFVLVDLGRPGRVLAVLLHPSPSSLMFWDILALSGYLLLCITILATSVLTKRGSPPRWLRGLVLFSIPWACAIHVVTALLYSGLSARPGWMTAIMAPKFLSTAFASGAALLILIARALNRARRLDIERGAILSLATVMAYAVSISLLFAFLEGFTQYCAGLPEAVAHLEHLYVPRGAHAGSAFWMLASVILLASALPILLVPRWRRHDRFLQLACGAVLLSVFIEKGFWLIPSGFVPTSLGYVASYRPNNYELLIAGGIHATGVMAFLFSCRVYLARSRQLRSIASKPNSFPPIPLQPGLALLPAPGPQ